MIEKVLKKILKTSPFLTEWSRAYLARREILHSMDFPCTLNIEPTNDCNLRCIMCPRLKYKRPVGYMSFDLYRKIVDEVAETGRKCLLILHKDGEPLKHPRIIEMIQYAAGKKGGISVRFSTNATLLDEKMGRELLESGLNQMTISLDGATAGSYNHVRQGSDFNDVMVKIENFLKLRRETGKAFPCVELQIIRMKETRDELTEFCNKWQGLADSVQVKNLLTWSGTVGTKRQNLPERYPCMDLWVHPAILWTGEVVVCCTHIDTRGNGEGIIGDLNKSSLREVWTGERLREIRLAHLHGEYGKVPFCTGCADWNYTGKVPATWSVRFKRLLSR